MSSGSPIQSLTKWLQLKIYQVEVTFSVYIFTPIEKFIFCTNSLPLRPCLSGHAFDPPLFFFACFDSC